MYSSYEVQVLKITASAETDTLTPSHLITSGFMLQFGEEKTMTTISGGDRGCLKWDGSATEMKLELEPLPNIDVVNVDRETLSNVTGVHGKGVQYLITFVGGKVRGNVPLIQMVGIAANGLKNPRYLHSD